MNTKLIRLLGLTSTYLPLVATTIVLLVATFDTSLLDTIPQSLLLATMAVSFIFVAVHLEQRLAALRASVAELGTTLSSLEATQRSYLEATTPDLSMGSLAETFARAVRGRDHVDHMRIYAISSEQIFSFVSNSDLTVDRCSLLIQGFPPDDESDFARLVRLVAHNWRLLASRGRIKQLEIRAYDYFPTDYEVLFDSDALILGLFDFSSEEHSKVRLRAATLFDGTSPSARAHIQEFRDRFDNLFEACATQHGPNPYAET